MTNSESKAIKLVNYITEKAIEGVGPMNSAQALANEYLNDFSFSSNSSRVDSLINWETSKNFTSGFITGLGGALTLPVEISAGFTTTWILQARLAAAIAHIYGHNIFSDRVKTMVLLSIVGDSSLQILKQISIQTGRKLTQSAIKSISGRVLAEINKKVGFRLLTKAGKKGVINLIKIVPVVGGIIGGGVDAAGCRAVGGVAKHLFAR